MIDGSGKHNRQLAFKLQNSHVCEKRSKPPHVEATGGSTWTRLNLKLNHW